MNAHSQVEVNRQNVAREVTGIGTGTGHILLRSLISSTGADLGVSRPGSHAACAAGVWTVG